MLNKIRGYRWELWLFLGLPIATAIASWILRLLIYPALDAGGISGLYLPVSGLVSLALLGVTYCRVRRLERPILRLVWQYSLVIGALSTALSLLILLRYETSDYSIVEFFIDVLWTGFLYGLFYLVSLVWFARKASRYGFDKALVLIGVSASPGLVFLRDVVNYPEYYTGVLILSAILSMIPVWALRRSDSSGIAIRSLAALFAAALVLQASRYFLPVYQAWPDMAVTFLLFVILPHSLAVGGAYLLRIRSVEMPPETEPHIVDKVDEEQEKLPEFTGLYKRKREDGEG